MTKSDILNELKKRIVDSLLQEKLSTKVWHFLPLSSMWSIAEHNGEMHLSRSERDSDVGIFNDINVNDPTKGMSYNGKEIAPYYLSLSRTPSDAMGYVRMRSTRTGKEWSSYLCRIEFDGDMLNRYFKGKAVNYFRNKYDRSRKMINQPDENGNENFTVYSITPDQNKLQPKTIHGVSQHRDDSEFNLKKRGRPSKNPVGYTDYNIIRRNQMSEYEDRLFSYEENVNLTPFMRRIDIFIGVNINRLSDDVKYEIATIIKIFPNITHIYNNEAAFNLAPTKMGNNGKYQEITKQFLNLLRGYKRKYIQKINNTQLRVIARLLAPIIFINNTLDFEYRQHWMDLESVYDLLYEIGIFKFFTKKEWGQVFELFNNELQNEVNKYYTDPQMATYASFKNRTDAENYLVGKLKYIQTAIYQKYIETAKIAANAFGFNDIQVTDPTKGIYTILRRVAKLAVNTYELRRYELSAR